MMRHLHWRITVCLAALFLFQVAGPNEAESASAREISRDAKRVLEKLYRATPQAKALGTKAVAVLVFPSITKGGFIVGGQYGEGALMKDGKVVGYYNTISASYGLQAGIQKYGYALFFMSEAALRYLDRSDGFELGSAPSIVIVDKGAAGGVSTTTAQSDMYAFFFDQKGLMGGLGLQGTKITKIEK
jgi:lipid-binding SYLF domain-containing protein